MRNLLGCPQERPLREVGEGTPRSSAAAVRTKAHGPIRPPSRPLGSCRYRRGTLPGSIESDVPGIVSDTYLPSPGRGFRVVKLVPLPLPPPRLPRFVEVKSVFRRREDLHRRNHEASRDAMDTRASRADDGSASPTGVWGDSGHQEIEKKRLWPCADEKERGEDRWCAALAVHALVVSFRDADVEAFRPMPSTLQLLVRPRKTPMEVDGKRIAPEDGVVMEMRRDKPGTYVTTQNMRFAGTTRLELGTENEVWAGFELRRPQEERQDAYASIPFEWRLEKADGGTSPEHKARQDACGHKWEQEVEISILGYLHETPCFLSRRVRCRRRSRRHMRRKTISATSLEAIAEDERVAAAKASTEQSLWHWGATVLPDKFERTCQAMTELAAGQAEGQGEQNITWFNAGVRIGVGVGLGVCLGVGLGVGVLMKSYSQAASTLKKKTFW